MQSGRTASLALVLSQAGLWQVDAALSVMEQRLRPAGRSAAQVLAWPRAPSRLTAQRLCEALAAKGYPQDPEGATHWDRPRLQAAADRPYADLDPKKIASLNRRADIMRKLAPQPRGWLWKVSCKVVIGPAEPIIRMADVLSDCRGRRPLPSDPGQVFFRKCPAALLR
jgi:hypothetical protein